MVIQSTGPISFSDIIKEFGFDSNLQVVSLSNLYANTGALGVGKIGSPNVPDSGTISLDKFYGATVRSATISDFPPIMNSNVNVINGLVYTASASSTRSIGTLPCFLFDGVITSNMYAKWQSNDNCYDTSNNAVLLRNFGDSSSFVDNYYGEYFKIVLPFPIYPTSYEIAGDMTSFRVYGSMVSGDWVVLDERSQAYESYTKINTYTFAATVTAKPYRNLLVKVNKSKSLPGFLRCAAMRFKLFGYQA